MKVKNKINITLICLILILLCTSTVIAKTIVKMKLSSESKLIPESDIEMTLSISDINNNGIDSMSGVFTYDTGVFGKLTEDQIYDSIKGQNGWSIQIYNPDNGKFILSNPSKSITPNSDMLKINLKVVDTIYTDKTNIKISDIVVSGGKESGDIKVDDISLTFTKDGVEIDNGIDQRIILIITAGAVLVVCAIILVIFLKRKKQVI